MTNLLLPFCLLISVFAYSQNLVINAPSSVAGSYPMILAEFGGTLPDPAITRNIVEVIDPVAPTSDGCDGITNGSAISGKIALIDRGACEFGAKCLDAQTKGAVAVIVCNNVAGAPIAMGTGQVGAQVTIPCVMISQSDCATIRVALAQGLNGSIGTTTGCSFPCNNDPSVTNGQILNDPLINGQGSVFTFNYQDNLNAYTEEECDPVTMVICMLNVVPSNGQQPVGGAFASNFIWQYDQATNCILGTQSQDLLAAGGQMSINFTVTNSTTCPKNEMGFVINIQPAPCMNGINDNTNDAISFYTCMSWDCQAAIQNNTDICALSPSPLDQLDCDGGGVKNIDECLSGGNPLDASDDCFTFNVKVLMEGPFDPVTQEMTTFLNVDRRILPGQVPASPLANPTPPGHPYGGAHWNYVGTPAENTFGGPYSSDITDWVLLTLRTDISNPATQVAQMAGLVAKDGQITLIESCLQLPAVVTSAYLIVEHRNHLPVGSPMALDLSSRELIWDFTASQSYIAGAGFGQKQVTGNLYAMYAGDGDQIADTQGYDINGSDNLLWKANSGLFDVYFAPDFSLDGDVNGGDAILWSGNNGIFSTIPK